MSYWISETGDLLRRVYNPWTRQTAFLDARPAISLTAAGALRVSVAGQYVPLARAIALAWIKTRRAGHVRCVDDALPPTRANLEWTRRNRSSEGSEDESSEEDGDSARWHPLCTQLGPITHLVPDCAVSSFRGAVRVPGKGTVSPCHSRAGKFVALDGVGVVHVRPPSREERRAGLSPRHSRTARALERGEAVDDVRARLGVSGGTAWSYAFEVLSRGRLSLRRARALVHPPLLGALRRMHAAGSYAAPLGGPLKALLPLVDRALLSDPDWRTLPYRYSELRFARMLLQLEEARSLRVEH